MSLLRAAGTWIRSAPGSYTWLTVIGATTSADDAARTRHSSNLANLARRPMRCLVSSAFWTESPALATQAVTFTALHAPAERWLGTRRWLTTAALGHVGATLLTQAGVAWGIREGSLDGSMRDVVDVGTSYGTAAVAGVLTYRVPTPWRWAYLAGGLALQVVPAIRKRTFTDAGHLTAFGIGLACRPLMLRQWSNPSGQGIA